MKKVIVWFRQDLRLNNNPALRNAGSNEAIMPIYIFDENHQFGSASKWWLHHSLNQLNHSLDGKLNLYNGVAQSIIFDLINKHEIDAVYWNRCYEPNRISEDSKIKLKLKDNGIECHSFNASLIWEPWEVMTESKTSYKVFSPFFRKAKSIIKPSWHSTKCPPNLNLIKDSTSLRIDDLKLLPKNQWYLKFNSYWTPGEEAAKKQLQTFLKTQLSKYKSERAYPAKNHTSRISPYLHFGEISPCHIWHSIEDLMERHPELEEDGHKFLSEIAWREFNYHLLYHYPKLPTENLQQKFNGFPWVKDNSLLLAWKRGLTGYPVIDAAMRQLWEEGYMHNRLRMAVGSFLCKNLRISWLEGANHFYDCLVDADLANNSANWQWIAGCGADPAPYFRIYNPITQGERFDPTGEFTYKYVPELKDLSIKYLFSPWLAPDEVLKKAKIKLGETYPEPIVDLKQSRQQALDTFYNLGKAQPKVQLL